jgi:transcriptional regulator with GAF, ATPase, and Fis domain
MSFPESKLLAAKARQYALELTALSDAVKCYVYEAHICSLEGNHPQAGRLSDEAWQIAGELDNEELRHWVAVSTADFLAWQGRIGEAVERYEAAIGNLEEIKGDPATLRACATLGWYYCICGQTGRGLGLIQEVRDAAQRLGDGKTVIWANLMASLALIDAGYLKEADPILSALLEHSEDQLGLMVLWAANHAMAYLVYRKGDLAECFRRHQAAVEYSTRLHWSHHKGPWCLEYLQALDRADLRHPEVNFHTELERLLGFPDTYMKGVALRFKVLSRRMDHQTDKEDLDLLEESLDLLEQAGARIESAHTKVLYGRLLLEQSQRDRGLGVLTDAWKVFSKVNESLFPHDLKPYVIEKSQEDLVVDTLVEAGAALAKVRTPEAVMIKGLNLAMSCVGAERGAFCSFSDEKEIQVEASRNLDRNLIHSPLFRESYETMARLVQTAQADIIHSGEPVQKDHRTRATAVWRLFVPVVLREQVFGIIFLECQQTVLEYQDKALLGLRAIGNLTALSMDNAKAYQEITHLKDRLQEENRLYKEELGDSIGQGRIIGQSRAMKGVYRKISQVARSDTTVLITGETGVGKELVAREIHDLSDRANSSFIPVNVSSLDPNLIASELFGHEKGAFTGATSTRLGRFELADKGTLFLDDVDSLPLEIQVKLLRVIQEREFERVGGTRSIRPNFRLIATTNKNLNELINTGRFRSDLFFRLNVFPIHVPALRERLDDIPQLALYFLESSSKRLQKGIDGITEADMQRLKDYRWPGNVRELKNVIERCVILNRGRHLKLSHLDEGLEMEAKKRQLKSLADMERSYILEILEICNWRISGAKGAAKFLDLKPSTLYAKMKRLGISRRYS